MTTLWTSLTRYAAASNDVVQGIDVRVCVELGRALTFQYVLRADMRHVRVPSSEAAVRTDGLWKHTCFEAFIAPLAGPAGGYYELNFSPSSQWAIYRFSAYREGMSPADVMAAPELTVGHFDDRLEVDATILADDLIAVRKARTLKLAVTAVIEDDSGTLSYWALKHAPGKPDFHHTDGFVLELPI